MGEYRQITAKEVSGKIFQALEQSTQMGWISQVAMASPSTSSQEKYAWLGQSPTFREWLGGRVIKKLSEFDYTITNKKYEATLGIAKDDLDRDKTGQLDIRISDFAERSSTHWAKLISALMISNGTCYDGQNFYDTDHSSGSSGTLSNTLAKAQYTSLDFTTTGKPTAIEMSNAILDMIGHFKTFKDDQGEPINEDASKFKIVVPTVDYWRAAIQAVSQMTLTTSGGASADNPLKSIGFDVSVVLNPRLNVTSYTQYFYVFRSDVKIQSFIMQEEGGVEVQMLDEKSDHYFNTDELLYGLKSKRNAGYGLWQYALRADGTT